MIRKFYFLITIFVVIATACVKAHNSEDGNHGNPPEVHHCGVEDSNQNGIGSLCVVLDSAEVQVNVDLTSHEYWIASIHPNSFKAKMAFDSATPQRQARLTIEELDYLADDNKIQLENAILFEFYSGERNIQLISVGSYSVSNTFSFAILSQNDVSSSITTKLTELSQLLNKFDWTEKEKYFAITDSDLVSKFESKKIVLNVSRNISYYKIRSDKKNFDFTKLEEVINITLTKVKSVPQYEFYPLNILLARHFATSLLDMNLDESLSDSEFFMVAESMQETTENSQSVLIIADGPYFAHLKNQLCSNPNGSNEFFYINTLESESTQEKL